MISQVTLLKESYIDGEGLFYDGEKGDFIFDRIFDSQFCYYDFENNFNEEVYFCILSLLLLTMGSKKLVRLNFMEMFSTHTS